MTLFSFAEGFLAEFISVHEIYLGLKEIKLLSKRQKKYYFQSRKSIIKHNQLTLSNRRLPNLPKSLQNLRYT